MALMWSKLQVSRTCLSRDFTRACIRTDKHTERYHCYLLICKSIWFGLYQENHRHRRHRRTTTQSCTEIRHGQTGENEAMSPHRNQEHKHVARELAGVKQWVEGKIT
ncbi:hypothetical protein J6590_024336 [Homalodisca vitripennis]|nr:hypothetical protein J6590_024336 [Homalodisca vitripennis]